MGKPLVPFAFYGGKSNHLGFILPIIHFSMKAHGIQTYNEVCGGSGAILLNKEITPIEIYNDVWDMLTNFFRVLRDRKEELIEKISLTPYSKREYALALSNPDVDELEAARLFFISIRMTMNGISAKPSLGKWKVSKNHIRRGISSCISQYLTSIERLGEIADRFMQVTIENDDFLKIIKKYDGDKTLHYIDPPYTMDTRTGGQGYKYEMNEQQHQDMIDLALNCKGKFIISSYENDLYKQLINNGWFMYKAPAKYLPTNAKDGGNKGKKKEEVVYTNFVIKI